MSSVLEGIRVLDLTIAMAGPFATQRLGDIGADVIKIEPVTGEWQRHAAAGDSLGNRINTSFLSLNRNKRSFAVDLKSKEGIELVYELVKSADVFVQNYRAGVVDRLGLDYETLRKLKEDLIYVSITGYGESGPYADRPGQDLLLQAMSGAMYSVGRDTDRPAAAGQYLVDAVTAYTAYDAALAALIHRLRTGEGQKVSLNMLDAIVSLQMQELSVYTVGNKPQKRSAEPHAHVYIPAPYGTFRTSDNKFVAIAYAPLDKRADLLDEPALAKLVADFSPENRDAVVRAIDNVTAKYAADELIRILGNAGLWIAPVYGYEDVVNDPQIAHNETFINYQHPTEGQVKTPGFPISFQKSPATLRRGAPLAGQHTREILEEVGVNLEQAQDLLKQGVVGEP